MPGPAVVPLILGLLTGAASGYASKKGEVTQENDRKQRDAFFELAKSSMLKGEGTFFEFPETQKAFKRLGLEELMAPMAAIASAPLTQEDRNAAMATLQAQTAQQGEAKSRADLANTFLQNITSRTQNNPVEFSNLPPTEQALVLPQAGAVGADVERVKSSERVAEQDRTSRADMVSQELDLKVKELAELRNKNATEARLKRAELDILRTDQKIRSTAVTVNKVEEMNKLAQTFSLTTPESRQTYRYLSGETDEINPALAAKVGQQLGGRDGNQGIQQLRLAFDQRKEAIDLQTKIAQGFRSRDRKTKVDDKEITSMMERANTLLMDSYKLQVMLGMLSEEEAQARLASELQVVTEDQRVMSPKTAAGLGLKFRGMPQAGGGSGEAVISPVAQSLLEEFTGGRTAD